MGDTAPTAGMPGHFEKEWAEARQLIDKQDERIQNTREKVFGLFSTLLTASSVFGSSVSSSGSRWLWVGAHLSLLGLLVTGRFIEQQAVLLQGAAASRAFVLELLTPVELTGTLSDRYRTGWVIGLTSVYVAYVLWIGLLDLKFAREGQDWSFSATSCRSGEVISILLTNLGDTALLPEDPPGELCRIANEEGTPVHEPGQPLRLNADILDVGRSLPPRRPLRWLWKASSTGIWALKVFGPSGGFTRRFIQVLPEAAPAVIPVSPPAAGPAEDDAMPALDD